MRIIPLSEVVKMEPEELVLAVSATVKAVFDPKEGGQGDKAYKFQDIILKDGKTEFKMTIKDRFDWTMPSDWKNKKILVNCTKSDKHGFTGVKVKDGSYIPKGKTKADEIKQTVLWVTATGEIALEGATGDEGTRAANTDETTPPPAESSKGTAQRDTQPASNGNDGKPNFNPARKGMLPLANMYFMAYGAAEYVSACRVATGKPEFTPAELQACCATLFIESAKCGLIGIMPTMSLKGHLHPPGSPEEAAAREAAKAEADRKAKEAAERERERIAAEAAKKAAATKPAEENLDEDVPF